jgi:hypothetical protein
MKIPSSDISVLSSLTWLGGYALVVNMSGQHVCVESRSSTRVGILASDMAYGAVRQGFESVRQGFEPGLQVFLCQQ